MKQISLRQDDTETSTTELRQKYKFIRELRRENTLFICDTYTLRSLIFTLRFYEMIDHKRSYYSVSTSWSWLYLARGKFQS